MENPLRKNRRRALARLNVCHACGGTVEASLSRLGSLRCHECIDEAARLNPLVVSEREHRPSGKWLKGLAERSQRASQRRR
jgi:hypothetical protein